MMQITSIRGRTTTILAGLFAAAVLVLGGCGGEEDPCADVDCDFGSCDSQSGECANPDECDEDVDCLAGYECEENACEAMGECSSDDDCDAGVCEDEVCVNPDSCEENDDCLERTFCGPDGTCEPDPCNEVDCARGECERGTDNCVSADECTVENELNDCAVGERCADGECADEEGFCDALECERGECSFQEGECVDADECESDEECLEGRFCNENGRCQTDLCDANDIECEEGGVCDPSSGLCENADECESNSDCRDDHVCLDETCQLEASACGDDKGDGGCPANQVCEVGGDEAECVEPDDCTTSFDCLDDRQCLGTECSDPIACDDDRFEPNDDADEATEFFDVAVDESVEGSICEGDTDVFAFDSSELVQQTQLARLIVEADVPERDHGLGELEMEITDPSGNVLTESSGPMGADGSARFEQWVGQADHGEYLVELSGDEELSEAGVGYELSVNLLPDESFGACDEPGEFEVGRRVSGDTDDAESTAVGSSCTGDNDAQTADHVYEFDVEEAGEVTFDLQPQLSGTDFALSVREECAEARSEMGCVESTVAEGDDQLSALLGEGTYYLIIQEASVGSGGPFTLESDWVSTECSRDDDHCEDDATANVCTSDGGRFRTIDCNQGCDPSTGRCVPPQGNSCDDAIPIEPEESDEEVTVEETLELEQMGDAYRLSSDSCIDEPPRTQGPDQVFEVELPARTAMEADVNFQDGVEGSMYVVDDCTDPSGSCLEGADGSGDVATNEQLTYSNTREVASETVYLIVDTAAYQTVTLADLELTFEPTTCQPGDVECANADELGTCRDDGLGYEDIEECEQGCFDGVCRDGSTCDKALVAEDGDQFSNTFDEDSVDSLHFPTGVGDAGECNFSSFEEVDSGDNFYEIELEEDELLTVDYSGDSLDDSTVYWLSDCTSINSCLQNEGSGDEGSYEYFAEEDQSVFFVVGQQEPTGLGADYADYTVDFTIEETECDPDNDGPQCADSGTAETCEGYGFWEQESCGLDCTSGHCEGDDCDAVIDATSDASQSGGVTYNHNWTDFNNTFEDFDCHDEGESTTRAADAVYSVDLADGETVDVELRNDPSLDSDEQTAPAVAISTSCSDAETTCVDGDDTPWDVDAKTASYTADGDETVYIIADNSWMNPDHDLLYEIDIEIH